MSQLLSHSHRLLLQATSLIKKAADLKVQSRGLLFQETMEDEDQLPHVFNMLSPQGEATDLDFAQFKGMLDATCYIISHMRACLSVI